VHVQASVLPPNAPSPLPVKELQAGKHSSLAGMNIAASNYGLFLDGNFMQCVVVTLPVEEAPLYSRSSCGLAMCSSPHASSHHLCAEVNISQNCACNDGKTVLWWVKI